MVMRSSSGRRRRKRRMGRRLRRIKRRRRRKERGVSAGYDVAADRGGWAWRLVSHLLGGRGRTDQEADPAGQRAGDGRGEQEDLRAGGREQAQGDHRHRDGSRRPDGNYGRGALGKNKPRRSGQGKRRGGGVGGEEEAQEDEDGDEKDDEEQEEAEKEEEEEERGRG
eukprot:3356902-Pyramimonas_sp.AAC.1